MVRCREPPSWLLIDSHCLAGCAANECVQMYEVSGVVLSWTCLDCVQQGSKHHSIDGGLGRYTQSTERAEVQLGKPARPALVTARGRGIMTPLLSKAYWMLRT